jgi:hypothetical protein
MMAKEKQQADEAKVKVKLNHRHEHARVKYDEGDVIEVPQSTADYMKQNGIADPV